MHAFISDFLASLQAWRKWYIIGAQSIRVRYSRSRLGQFWISLSFLITIIVLGIVYTHLWKVDIATYLPYLAASQMFWLLISGTVADGCATFTGAEPYMRAEDQPKGIYALMVMCRQFIIFGHNFIALVPVFIFMGVIFHPLVLLSLLGLVIVMFNMYWVAIAIGMLCARFRDLPSLINSLLQILFFVTPVMWLPETITDPTLRFWLVEVNPFAAMLSVVRDPLLGHMPLESQYVNVAVTSVLGTVITALFYGRLRNRIVYWL